MERIEYHGWPDCVRLSNDVVDVIVSAQFGPRIMRFGFIGGANVLGEDESLFGTVGPPDKWVNYGGHRLWHAPEAMPRTYEPDNAPVQDIISDGDSLVVKQRLEPKSGIGKSMVIRLAAGASPSVEIDHIITNHTAWSIEAAPWALSVVAPGGRVILPQEPFIAHGEGDQFAPARPLVLWPFTDMSDPRFTWGKRFVQLRSDPATDGPQKIGVFNSPGWAAYHGGGGDLFFTFIDTAGLGPDDMADMGCNFETFTKGEFQELESLGPLDVIEPGEQAVHTIRWVLVRCPGLPDDDDGLEPAITSALLEAHAHIARLRS